MKFEAYPFEKLNELLKDITPNNELKPIVLTIGEPQFETPKFITDELCSSSSLLNKYPKSAGEDYQKCSNKFCPKKIGVQLCLQEIIPTFGTREVLFNFPQYLLFGKPNPVMAYTNPFYQIYEGAAIASGAKVIHINMKKENDFRPIISDDELKTCDLVIINYPSNPTSACISLDEMVVWVQKALEFNFVLVNDECYSELFFDELNPPPSLLEASIKAGNTTFRNILVMNSISKRSSAPGLRSGFIAGDAEILKGYLQYRTYIGCAVPLPLQKAAAAAWNDEEHTKEFRKIYKRNFELAKKILDIAMPQATFYIWLEVKDELAFTKELYRTKNIKVLPGSFLGRDGGGVGFVRIALVENEKNTKEALTRIKEFLNN